MDMKRDFLAEYSGECLYHHGIMGQKWGVRRFQNKDGSLTEAGRKRYLNESGELNDKGKKRFLSRDDGTYYDLTKYSRKLGALGGIIDTARYAKEIKEQKTINQGRRQKLYDDLKTNGWTGDNGSQSFILEKNGKMGKNDVLFQVLNDGVSKISSSEVNRLADRCQKEHKKVLSTNTNQISNQMGFDRNKQELVAIMFGDDDNPNVLTLTFANHDSKNADDYNIETKYDMDADRVLSVKHPD